MTIVAVRIPVPDSVKAGYGPVCAEKGAVFGSVMEFFSTPAKTILPQPEPARQMTLTQ